MQTLGRMGRWMDGWMCRWEGGERRIFFHMTLCRRGQPLTPTPPSLFPRRAVSATGLAVLASLGHSGIPSLSCPPSPCLRLSLALSGFPSLLPLTLLLELHLLPVYLPRHACFSGSLFCLPPLFKLINEVKKMTTKGDIIENCPKAPLSLKYHKAFLKASCTKYSTIQIQCFLLPPPGF